MDIKKTYDGAALFSCRKCALAGAVPYSSSDDESYLEFLTLFDQGLMTGADQNKMPGLVRSRDEIDGMIGDSRPGKVMLDALYSQDDYVSHYAPISSPPPDAGALVDDLGLDGRLSDALKLHGIDRFYKFQEEAIDKIRNGCDTVIESPTASGKTEAFLVPILDVLGRKPAPGAAAVFVYPTKALARDQLPKIKRYADKMGIDARIFDGDVGDAERRQILDRPPEILVTNFDVLHYHLWHRTKFSSLLHSVRFLAVDEVHTYSGIFGSNVHYVVMRLKRIAPKLQIVAASATLDNAAEFCSQLFETKIAHVKSAARKGEIDLAMIFPSLRGQWDLITDLARKLTLGGHKTMVFSNSHRSSEILAMRLRKSKVKIKVHRAGLGTAYRRSVEDAFKSGRLSAISCTPTLELGIDIGDVDGVVSAIIPVNRLMQRIGRAARKGQRGYAFLALGNDPISQYYSRHPKEYFRDVERCHIDPKNPFVESSQILAMACDMPLSAKEAAKHADAVRDHVIAGRLRKAASGYAPVYPAAKKALDGYSIRGIGHAIDILLGGKKIGDRLLPMALEELHREAIYLHAGTKYEVISFDYSKMRALLRRIPARYPYITRALTSEMPHVEEIYQKRRVFGTEAAFCRLRIEKSVYGYVKYEPRREDSAQQAMIDPLRYDLVTKGIVFAAPEPAGCATAADADHAKPGGYHAAEHIMIEGSNMIIGGASRDLGGISLGETGLIFIYDGAMGGNGASRALYDRMEQAASRSLSIARECPCDSVAGCPRCTFSYRCGNNNDILHKGAAREILQRMNDGQKTDLDLDIMDDRPLV